VPTWRELGVDMAYTSWRAIVAPRSTSEADVRAAAAAFASLAASPEWRSELDRQLWIGEYGGPEYTRRFLQEEYDEHRALLAQLGLVR
jgi:putative tricarboxylic transport membrane protein